MIVIGIGGEPATGKSTIMKTLMRKMFDSNGNIEKQKGITYTTFPSKKDMAVVLGYYEIGSKFGGTDRLSMGVQGTAEVLLKGLESTGDVFDKELLVLFEGDRLMNGKFIKFIQSNFPKNKFFVINSEESVKEIRHGIRDNQNETWLKGRKTKVENIKKQFSVVELDNNIPGDVDHITNVIIQNIEQMRNKK